MWILPQEVQTKGIKKNHEEKACPSINSPAGVKRKAYLQESEPPDRERDLIEDLLEDSQEEEKVQVREGTDQEAQEIQTTSEEEGGERGVEYKERPRGQLSSSKKVVKQGDHSTSGELPGTQGINTRAELKPGRGQEQRKSHAQREREFPAQYLGNTWTVSVVAQGARTYLAGPNPTLPQRMPPTHREGKGGSSKVGDKMKYGCSA